MYKKFLDFLKSRKYKITLRKSEITQEGVDYIETNLGFPLPDSYKWWNMELGAIQVGRDQIKIIAPPQFRDTADVDILYSYKVNLENNILAKNELSILETEDEIYYFKVEPGIEGNEYQIYFRDVFSNNQEDVCVGTFLEFLKTKMEEFKQ